MRIVSDINYTIVPLTDSHYEFLQEMLYQSIYVPQGTATPPYEIIDKPALQRYFISWGRTTDYGLCAVSTIAPSTTSALGIALRDVADDATKLGAVWLRYFSSSAPGYGFISEDVPELGMAVAQPYRGHGIGTALLRRLLSDTTHILSISLSVHKDNPAQSLYRRCGFYRYATDGDSLIMRYDRA